MGRPKKEVKETKPKGNVCPSCGSPMTIRDKKTLECTKCYTWKKIEEIKPETKEEKKKRLTEELKALE